MIFLKGNLTEQEVNEIANNLANKVIQRIHIKNIQRTSYRL